MGIKIITEPTVHLVGKSSVDDWGVLGFLDENVEGHWQFSSEVDPQNLVEIAGRLCYMSFKSPRPGGNEVYIKHILEVGHGSVLEHACYSLIFTGVSRSLTHELVRHRAGMSYSQLSQRYVDESDVAFVVPPQLAAEVKEAKHYVSIKGGDPTQAYVHSLGDNLSAGQMAGLRWILNLDALLENYKHQVKYLNGKLDSMITDKTERRKAARESARSVLPNCTETKIFVTGNGRSLRHFLELRGSLFADAEIRRLALATLPILVEASPAIFGDYVVETTDGIDHITTLYRKV